MRNLGILALTLCSLHSASSASHSLKYLCTAVTPGIEFPEYTAVGMVDEEPFVHYDSSIRRMVPRTEWIKGCEGASYWDRETQKQIGTQETFKANIEVLMERFNQTQGVHTLQWMYGCEWDDESGATGGFNQFGYDGEDFLTLDMKEKRFVASVEQAVITAQAYNNGSGELEVQTQYLKRTCVYTLKKYVRYGKSDLERTVPPQVSLLQKDPSSPVTCHVTGFYPPEIMVTWQKNGQELDVDVELGETVPNGDGTFQTRSHLKVNPEDWKRDRFTCTVQHKSLEQDIILPVTEENIKSNMDIKKRIISPDGSSSSTGIIIISCVVGALLLLLLLAAIGVLVSQKKGSGYGKTSNSDSDSESSSRPSIISVDSTTALTGRAEKAA